MDILEQITQIEGIVGEFIEYWGFRRIHGRIWAVIYLSERPVSTPEIVALLEVSKGLVSVALQELRQEALILEGPKIAHGAQTYIPNEDVGSVVRRILRNRELQLLTKADDLLGQLSKVKEQELRSHNLSMRRIEDLHLLVKGHRSLLSRLVGERFANIRQWTQVLHKAKLFYRAKG